MIYTGDPNDDTRKTDELAITMLIAVEGFDSIEEMIEEFFCDSVFPGICMNQNCEYTISYEPDQAEGWCEICETNTVVSGGILAGLY